MIQKLTANSKKRHKSTVKVKKNVKQGNQGVVHLNVFGSGGGGGGVLPYMGYIGMCRCKGYGFQALYSSVGNIIQSVWV